MGIPNLPGLYRGRNFGTCPGTHLPLAELSVFAEQYARASEDEWMIDGLVAGKLHGKAVARTGATSGKAFVTAKLRAATANGEQVFVDAIAFRQSARTALLVLDDGDSTALSGELTAKTWTDREGQARVNFDMVVHAVLTPYHVRRKRLAVEGEPEQKQVAPSGDLDAGASW